jgi:glycine/D-amino acid oxidase-like deaminating enzyme
MNEPILIVGAGLAGTVLALQLEDMGANIVLLDSYQHTSSSQIAGGLYNPVTGRAFQLSWKAEKLFPFLEDFYKSKEQKLNAKFLHPSPIHFSFSNVSEQNTVQGKSADYRNITLDTHPATMEDVFYNEYGTFTSSHSGWFDVATFLSAAKSYFASKQKLWVHHFEYNAVNHYQDKVVYKDQSYSKIIFCEGVHIQQNPFFQWLPMKPNKGELIEIEFENDIPPINTIWRKKVFLIPVKDKVFRCGSTYAFEFNDAMPTAEALEELKTHLADLVKVPYQIKAHKAGVRPASKDRKPFIGFHPIHNNLGVFNGLGSKGVSLAPFFALHFSDNILNKVTLEKEINIIRYF